jgi:hypothetical protein
MKESHNYYLGVSRRKRRVGLSALHACLSADRAASSYPSRGRAVSQILQLYHFPFQNKLCNTATQIRLVPTTANQVFE